MKCPGSNAASAAASVAVTKTCGTRFTDTASSALLADIVLEARIRDKVPLKDNNNDNNNSPEAGGSPGGQGMYEVVAQVRKRIWKGKELVKLDKRRKIKIGKFTTGAAGDHVSNVVSIRPAAGREAAAPGEGDGGEEDSCVGDVDDGATYIFFLRDVGDKKGNYFELSALPVKKNRREARIVSKILKKNGGKYSQFRQSIQF
nr:hypothetical protein BaRGS_024364 [Batillaria attramentaria]